MQCEFCAFPERDAGGNGKRENWGAQSNFAVIDVNFSVYQMNQTYVTPMCGEKSAQVVLSAIVQK